MTARLSRGMCHRVHPRLLDADVRMGGKAASVCRLAAIPGIRIPKSSVLDARALLRFARASFSEDELATMVRDFVLHGQRGPLFARLAHAPFPPDLVREIVRALPGRGLLMVRSSGTSEDAATTSLAGHYASLATRATRRDLLFAVKGCWLVGLRVYLDHLLPCSSASPRDDWHDVSRRALTSVALLLQEVVAARGSGIYFSRSPIHPRRALLVANWGTCHSCVDGRMPADQYVLDGENVESASIRHKFEMTVFCDTAVAPLPGSPVDTPLGPSTLHFPYGEALYSARVPAPFDGMAVLDAQKLAELTGAARRIREVAGYELDMEWSFDERGLVVLQARPITTAAPSRDLSVTEGEDGLVVASAGVATGPVRIVLSPGDVARVDRGDLIAVQATDPDYMPILYRCAGVISEEGSPLSHTAIVARELGLPCLLGVRDATRGAFQDGEIVTLDADHGCIDRNEPLADPGNGEPAAPAAGSGATGKVDDAVPLANPAGDRPTTEREAVQPLADATPPPGATGRKRLASASAGTAASPASGRNDVVYDVQHLAWLAPATREAEADSSAGRVVSLAASALIHGFSIASGWADPDPQEIVAWLQGVKANHGIATVRVHWDLCDDRNVAEEADPRLRTLGEMARRGDL